MRMSLEFSGVPIVFRRKPLENWSWLPRKFPLNFLSAIISLIGETFIEKRQVKSLMAEAVKFGREQNVDRVWAVLQGQTNIRMALAVSNELGVPLHSHIWDVFGWWARTNRIDSWTFRNTQNLFDETIRKSISVAAASRPMAEEYRDRFHVKAVALIPGLPGELGRSPTASIGETLTIGMAGQFYAADEWRQLITCLENVQWTIGERRIRIIAMGPKKPPLADSANVTFLGWKTQKEAVDILSGCDFLYCPYPFAQDMEDVARYSFPSKLVLYLAAGRPVIFHGPDFSPPAKYISQKGCGVTATEPSAQTVISEIESLSNDPGQYQTIMKSAQSAFLNDFTLDSMARNFKDFIGDPMIGEKIKLHDHTIGEDEMPQADRLPSNQRGLLSMLYNLIKPGRSAF